MRVHQEIQCLQKTKHFKTRISSPAFSPLQMQTHYVNEERCVATVRHAAPYVAIGGLRIASGGAGVSRVGMSPVEPFVQRAIGKSAVGLCEGTKSNGRQANAMAPNETVRFAHPVVFAAHVMRCAYHRATRLLRKATPCLPPPHSARKRHTHNAWRVAWHR